MYSSPGQNSLGLVGGKQAILQKSPEEIVLFLLKNDTSELFNSVQYWPVNFYTHIKRLLEARQIFLFFEGDRITGACGWACIDDTKDVNKVRWTLPDNITDGKILYISFAVLDKKANMFLIKRAFESMGYRNKVCQVRWGNRKRQHNFQKG